MRFARLLYWLTVLILAIGVPLGLYKHGTSFDRSNGLTHPADTTGGTLTIAICVVLGVFILLLLMGAVVVWAPLRVRSSGGLSPPRPKRIYCDGHRCHNAGLRQYSGMSLERISGK
jgi:hypothetical protein